MRDALKFYVPLALVVVAGFAVALWYADPAPPKKIRMATGGGAYTSFAQRFRDALEKEGVEVQLVESRGALENVTLLSDRQNGVDVAYVQGGSLVDSNDYPDLESLGSMYREPIWIFVRTDRRPTRISDLAGLRVAVGAPGSGVRAVADEMLSVNGLGAEKVRIVEIADMKSVEAMQAGEVDAAFFVTGAKLNGLRRLATTPGIQLMTLERAKAYARLYDGISPVTLPQGALNLAANEPSQDITLISAIASLVAHKGLHPAVAQLLIETSEKIHGGRKLFSDAGEFPSPNYVDFPLSSVAQRYFEHGPSILRSYLPYWAANLVNRLWILLLPVIALLIPLMRIAPPVFVWQIRRRIYKWYRHLHRIELAEHNERDPTRRRALLDDLETLHRDVVGVRVPLSYSSELYALLLHIQLIRELLAHKMLDSPIDDTTANGSQRHASSI